MAEIKDFEKAKIRINNFFEIIDRYTCILKGYYYALDGVILSDKELRQEAIELFSVKKKNGLINNLNEIVDKQALSLERKNNLFLFSAKKENKCQKI